MVQILDIYKPVIPRDAMCGKCCIIVIRAIFQEFSVFSGKQLKQSTMADDLKLLLELDSMLYAKEVKQTLEEIGIYSTLESDNPASSLMNVYTGDTSSETVRVIVHVNDYENAKSALLGTFYESHLQ
jgi:hypothetical protein